MTSTKRSPRLRSMSLLIAGVFVGATMLSPAFANHTPTHTKKQINNVKKKLTKKLKKRPTKKAVDNAITSSISEVINLMGDSWIKATPTTGADEPTARAAAPKIPLLTSGDLSLYAKCFAYAPDTVHGEIFIETTAAGAVFEGNNGGLGGAPDYLNPATPETERSLLDDMALADAATYAPKGHGEWHAMSPGGTALDGSLQIGVKNGAPPGGDGLFGPGDVCLFAGFAAGN